jgi:hypothetical protein
MIDRYILAHYTKYYILQTPQTPSPSPPTGYETSCVAGWSELELASLLTLRSELNVLKICVLAVPLRRGEEDFWLGPAGSSGDSVGSNFSSVMM